MRLISSKSLPRPGHVHVYNRFSSYTGRVSTCGALKDPTSPLTMNRHKRRLPASFEWHTVPTDDVDSLPDIRLKHTHIHVSDSGSSSRRTTYIQSPASPIKKSASSNNSQYDFVDEPMSNEADPSIEFDEELDPAYVHHFSDRIPEIIQRKRPPQVCYCLIKLPKRLTL